MFIPDGTVVCGPPVFDPLDTIINPRVIVEVLSDSTEGYDRGEKFTRYREIKSLEEYVLISQHKAQVETFLRQTDDTWSFAAWAGLESIMKLRSLQLELPLGEIYAQSFSLFRSRSPQMLVE